MVKTPSEAQVYAVLMDGKKEEQQRVQRRRRRLLSTGSLVFLSVTLAAIVTFHLWVTWQLQQKVTALQVQVDGLLTLNLPELRNQFGDLYDLRDLSFPGLRGPPTSPDQDNEGDGFAERDPSDDSDEDDIDDDDDDYDDEESVYSDSGRRKRQADLSSHTEDGVPIYDRGYGVSTNRTEGLRIYQSLLNGGRSVTPKTSDSNPEETTSWAILPHHRQNRFWKEERKDRKDRHFPSPRTTTRPSNTNVQFRSSRVKPSVLDQPTSRPDVQKLWPASATSRNDLNSGGASGASSASGATGGDERINAATAPAVTSTTSRRDHRDHRKDHKATQRRNGAIFKVQQPSGEPAPVQATDYGRRPAPVASSPAGKKRYHKKHLRQLDHLATAVHLVADPRNSTSNIQNEVEMASRNELGLHTSWKMADLSMAASSLVKIDGATITVKESGLYFIYAQVHYLDAHVINAYEVFVNTEPFLRCVTSSHWAEASQPVAVANTCYTAATTQLRDGDKLFLRDIEPMRYSVLQPSKTFFGLVRIAPISH